MDQVKQYLAVAGKHGFWIGCGVILIGSLLAWYFSTSSLEVELESRTSTIKRDVSQVRSVQSQVPTAPNPTSHSEMERLISERTSEVVDAWRRMFERQRTILTWPRKELRDDFVAEFEDKIPIEEYVLFPTEEADEVDPSIRVRYQYYIDRVLPGIAAIAGAEWTAPFETTTSAYSEGMDDGSGEEYSRTPELSITGAEEAPLVKWGTGSQSAVLSDLFPWRGSRPTTLEVYYSQENIWVLKQMLEIVAAVNGDARMPFQAKIREIKNIAIGRSANFDEGEISKPGEALMGFGSMDEYGMDDYGMEEEEMMEEEGDWETGGEYGPTVDPADNRYVDTRLEPITGEQLRAALASSSPTDANLAVAKRVPVMMSVKMDQRAVPDLLAACGSANLMVEVRQVRIRPDGGATASNYSEDQMEEEESYSSYVPEVPENEFPFDMLVDVYGLIYIYNPPQAEKLGVEQVDENTVIDGVAVGESEETTLPAPGGTVDQAPATDAPETGGGESSPPPAAPTDESPATTVAPPTALRSPG